MEALVIDTEAWYEDANTNLRSLKHDVGWCITESAMVRDTYKPQFYIIVRNFKILKNHVNIT